MRRTTRIFSLLTLTLLTLACLPTFGPAPAPVPTFDANAPLTAIVQTAGVAMTQTALHAPPTSTPTATASPTPSITPTQTPTFFIIIVTPTQPPTQIPVGSSNKDYDCQILSVEPSGPIAVSSAFTAKWTVVNIGKSTWDGNNADYRYNDGARLYRQSIYDFPATISPGVTVELTADMQAPSDPGTYTTSWIITIGKIRFCKMELTITVI
jgi:hypothetical protein